jgi:hypothetical protein
MTDLFTADQPDERSELLQKWSDKTKEELLEAKINSDLYIKTLERQKDELVSHSTRLNDDLQARENLQALIDRLNKVETQTPSAPTGLEERELAPKIEDIEKIVASKIEENKLREIETRNFNTVQSKLADRFGANTANVLNEQANALGLSKEDVNALARKSPEAFFRIMGLNDQPRETFQSPTTSSMRPGMFAPKNEKRTWAWYQDLKRKDFKAWSDPKTQLQMHRDAEVLGPAFEDGDFNAYGAN